MRIGRNPSSYLVSVPTMEFLALMYGAAARRKRGSLTREIHHALMMHQPCGDRALLRLVLLSPNPMRRP